MEATNVLVTGGCGKIGKKLVDKLVAKGYNVSVIDRVKGDIDRVNYIVSDIMKLKDLGDTDIVFHLAARIDYSASEKELIKDNVEPTEKLLSLCSKCKRFIFMSTTSVYGEAVGPITEYSPTEPTNAYGKSKLLCEQKIKDSGVPYTIIRASQVFGPDFEQGYSTVLKHIKACDMKIFGSGDNYVPLVHVDDLVSALLFLADSNGAENQIINIDGNYQKTQKQFLALAAQIIESQTPNTCVNPKIAKLFGKFLGKGDTLSEYVDKLAKNRKISIEKLKNLGFEPQIDLEIGMREVVEVFRKKGII